MNDLVSTSGAARRLNCSESWIRRLADTGKLPTIRTPLGRMFERGAVEAFATAQKRQQSASRLSK